MGRIDNKLVTASAGAILAIYAAGFSRTESASEEFVRRFAHRRVAAVSARVASVQDGLKSKVEQLQPGDAEYRSAGGSAPALQKVWKDGKYTGWGYSPHGNIEASVTVEGGRIANAI